MPWIQQGLIVGLTSNLRPWALVPLKTRQAFLLTSSIATVKSRVHQLSLWLFLSWSKTWELMNVSFGKLSRMVFNSKSVHSPYWRRNWKIPISRHLQQKSKQYPWSPGILPPKLCWPVNLCAFEDWNISGKTCKLYLQAWSRALTGVPQLAYYTLFFMY